MAMACGATNCTESAEEWRSRHAEAQTACSECRYFEAVQLVNAALEALEQCLGEGVREGLLLTEPARFVEECGEALPSGRAGDVAALWATRADILMNLGGLRRAADNLAAAARLAPEDQRVLALTEECERVQKAHDEAVAEQAELATKSKIPAHLITGFLGSGKTTLLNHILHGMHGKRYAVIENEFGEIGIDDALISAGREDLGAEQIIEMNNGCICCTVRGDLIKGLKNILKRTASTNNRLDGVIIETTGLADPAPVAQTFFADDYIQARMVLDGIVTVVDAKHVLQHLREEKPPGVENEAVEQIAFADRILLNKIDIVDEKVLEEVESEIHKINSVAPIRRTQMSKVDVTEVLGIGGFSLDRVLEMDTEFLSDAQDHQHDSTVGSVGIECSGECDLRSLNAWVATLLKERGADIFRMKGILVIKGHDRPFVFQGIHMIFGGQPQGEWKLDERRVNRLVFIGRNLHRAELERGFKETLAQ